MFLYFLNMYMYIACLIEDYYCSYSCQFYIRFWKDHGVMAQWVQAPSR